MILQLGPTSAGQCFWSHVAGPEDPPGLADPWWLISGSNCQLRLLQCQQPRRRSPGPRNLSCQACAYGPVSSAEVPLTDTGLMHDQDQSLRSRVWMQEMGFTGDTSMQSPTFIPCILEVCASDLEATSVFLVLDIRKLSQSNSVFFCLTDYWPEM